jgi:hypothetical protein
MRLSLLIIAVLSLSTLDAQKQDRLPNVGVIYGTVLLPDGTPAKRTTLNAMPRNGAPLGMALPWTETDDAGVYHFERLPLCMYSVYAEYQEARYSGFTTGTGSIEHPTEVELTAEHPEAELNFALPPPAGFLLFHLTNRTTGTSISGVEVTVMSAENPSIPIFSGGQSSSKPFLLPSNQNLLLHIKSWGFREWNQSVGNGKQVRIAPGERLTMDVQLQPANPLRERIPDADPKKYQGIHDGKDWKNPCLIVLSDGVVISGVNNGGNPMPVKAVAEALESLPDSAWPYGSVVAVQDYRVAASESERSRIEANQMLLEPLLSELGVLAGFRPTACASPNDQAEP